MTLSLDFKSRVDRRVKELPEELLLAGISASTRMKLERPDLETAAYALMRLEEEAEKRGLMK